MKKFLQNIVKLKEISTIKDFRFGTFPSISGSGSGSGYTFCRPPLQSAYVLAGGRAYVNLSSLTQ